MTRKACRRGCAPASARRTRGSSQDEEVALQPGGSRSCAAWPRRMARGSNRSRVRLPLAERRACPTDCRNRRASSVSSCRRASNTRRTPGDTNPGRRVCSSPAADALVAVECASRAGRPARLRVSSGTAVEFGRTTGCRPTPQLYDQAVTAPEVSLRIPGLHDGDAIGYGSGRRRQPDRGRDVHGSHRRLQIRLTAAICAGQRTRPQSGSPTPMDKVVSTPRARQYRGVVAR